MATGTFKAFHGNAKVKAKYLKRVRAHQKADAIVQGHYWQRVGKEMKGCAVGCTIHGSDHAAYERELGIPQIIARLEDRIFEGLTIEESKKWPAAFLNAIKPGADLSKVWPKFAIYLMTEVRQYAKREQTLKAIDDVKALYERVVAGEVVTAAAWRSDAAWRADAAAAAADAAADADAAAADAAWRADAAAAAADAAWRADAAAAAAAAAWRAAAWRAAAWRAAAWRADAAADAAWRAAAWRAAAAADAAWRSARANAYAKMSIELLRLLREAK